jgi:toxin ParE1/3/4
MAEIIWTAEAETWLHDIYNYIAQDSSEAAISVVQGIYQRAQQLLAFPQSGQIYRIEQDGDIRILLYGHYRIAYHVGNDNRIVILGVFHGALDLERYLP